MSDAEQLSLILDELRMIRRVLETRSPAGDNGGSDKEILRRMLPAIGGLFGDNAFQVWEVLDDPALRKLSDGISVSALGSLFARNINRNIDGLVIQRGEKNHNSRRWRLARVASP